MAADPAFAAHYAAFVQEMVYGEVCEFERGISTVEGLADGL
jgi:hypothetical protein